MIKGDRGRPAKNPPILKLVFVFWKLRNFQLLWNSENLTLFCLDESLYSRPYRVTAPIFVEISKVQTQLPQLL